MKILHTADWHLNDKLRRQDRTEHLRRRVEKVAEICEQEGVDVLLIAGDVFSDLATGEQVADSFRHLRRTFSGFLGRGGVAIAVTGNHDQDGRIKRHLELARAGMEIAEPPKSRGDQFRPGKVYLVDTGFVGRVEDTRGKFDVQFVLVPFPSWTRLLTGEESGTTSGELNRSTQALLSGWLRDVSRLSGYDERLQTVLMAHMHVRGADIGRGLFRLTEEQDVILEEADLLNGFAYIALGHIHKPQCIRGMSHVRYAGSLDRMDFGELGEKKSVVLVEIGPKGRVCEPKEIEIEATPMEDLTLDDPMADREAISRLVPNAAESLIRVTIAPSAASASGVLDRAVREAFPNVAWVEKPRIEFSSASSDRAVVHGDNFRATVLDYLSRRVGRDHIQRDEILALAAAYLDGGAGL